MNEDAHLGIDDWLIIVGGYGAFEFRGTESEAEEMRRNKSRWEGAVAKKRRLTKRAADETICTCTQGFEHPQKPGHCGVCGNPFHR